MLTQQKDSAGNVYAFFTYTDYGEGIYSSSDFARTGGHKESRFYLDTGSRITKSVTVHDGTEYSVLEKYYDGLNITSQRWLVSRTGEVTRWRQQVFEYDNDNRMTMQINYDYGQANAITAVRRTYGDYGNATTDINANNVTRVYDYDGNGMMLTRTVQHGGQTLEQEWYVYDGNSQQITYCDTGGVTHAYDYDANGNMITQTADVGGLAITDIYFPDEAGRVTKRQDAENNAWFTEYDNGGNVTLSVDPRGLTQAYVHDSNQNLLTQQTYGNGSLTRTTVYIYDTWSRLVTQRRQLTDGGSPTYADIVYAYNDNDRVTHVESPDGEKTGTIYGPDGRASYSLADDGSGWITKASYLYDMVGHVTKQTDHDGIVVSSMPAYDGYGRVTRSTAPGLHYAMYYYDATGQTTRQENYDKDGGSLASADTAYDALGRGTRVTDALSHYSVSDYDAAGGVTRQAGYDSSHTAVSESHMEYDKIGRITRSRQLVSPGSPGTADNTNDAVVDTLYDDLGRNTRVITHLTDSVAATKTYKYDGTGNLLTQTGSDAPDEAFVYNIFGEQTNRIVDPDTLAISSTSEYDDVSGRLTKSADPSGTYYVPHYSTGGRVTLRVSYESGGTAAAASGSLYDATGRVTKTYRIADPANRLTYLAADDPAAAYLYDDSDRLTRTEDPNSNATTYDYDSCGRQVTITDAASNKFINEYDKAGRHVTLVRLDYDGSNHVTFKGAYEFDALNRATKTTQVEESLESIVWFDAAGRTTLTQDPKGTQVAALYDGLGRVTRKTEDSSGIARYTDYNHDRASRVTQQLGYPSDANNAQTTAYAYSKAGVMTSVTYPDNEKVEYFYDNALRMISKVDQESQPTTVVYDSMGRPTAVTKGSEIDTFTYTALGELSVAARGTNSITRHYNGLGRLTRETQIVEGEAAKNVDYDYDKASNVLTVGYPGGTDIAMTYDNGNRLSLVKRGATELAEHLYVGSRVRRLRYAAADAVTATRLYDGAARLTRLTWSHETDTLPDFIYAYDKAGNILTKTHDHRADDPIEKYDIDGLYRLTDARYDFRTLTHSFDYDDLGNQLTFTYNAAQITHYHNEVNEITRVDGTQVYHDDNGNLTKDAAGNPGPYTYYYNRDNQLTKVMKTVGDPNVAEYAYDALGRRVEFVDCVNSVTKRYYHDGDRVIEEYDDVATPARQRYYVWGNYVDELLVLTSDKDGGDPDYFPCHNHLFSPEALVDSTGTIVERYDYDAYGQPTIYTADGVDNTWFTSDDTTATVSDKGLVYLFTGREYDGLDTNANLPLQYSRARYYSFPLRRWLQRDPIGYADGMSLYEYVGSGPVMKVDMFGLYEWVSSYRFQAKRHVYYYGGRAAPGEGLDLLRKTRTANKKTVTLGHVIIHGGDTVWKVYCDLKKAGRLKGRYKTWTAYKSFIRKSNPHIKDINKITLGDILLVVPGTKPLVQQIFKDAIDHAASIVDMFSPLAEEIAEHLLTVEEIRISPTREFEEIATGEDMITGNRISGTERIGRGLALGVKVAAALAGGKILPTPTAVPIPGPTKVGEAYEENRASARRRAQYVSKLVDARVKAHTKHISAKFYGCTWTVNWYPATYDYNLNRLTKVDESALIRQLYQER